MTAKMTINQYLFALELLKDRRDRAFESYMRAHNRASAPKAAHIDPDGITSRSGYNSTEDKLIRAADAWARYNKADKLYYGYSKQLDKNLETLEKLYGWPERAALEIIYIENMGKPLERRRGGICRRCNCHTKSEAAELVRQAKQHLTEILIAQGVEIEQGSNNGKTNN